MADNNSNWNNGDILKVTSESGISVSPVVEEVPSVTVATIIGITAIILIAIVAVFVLGVMIDCRQQRLIEQKMDHVKRLKNLRAKKKNPRNNEEGITENMEESGMSEPPALAAIRVIP